jgi:hypothetical protein
MVSEMTPPKAHWQVEPATRTGTPPASVCGAIGIHGAGTAGTHGIGVSTPSAAAVAAATVGFASDWHIPNGAMLAPGAMSVMTASGRPSTIGLGATTASVDGAIPKVQAIIAPETAHGLPTGQSRIVDGGGGRVRHTRDSFAEVVSSGPVVVTKQITDRSSDCSQPRAEGSR